MNSSSLPSLIQRFFTDRLLVQLDASSCTVAANRDAFRLLFQYATATLGRAPSDLRIEDLEVSFLGKFLEHLESERTNCTRTRNNRLSALRAFFRYVAVSEPAFAKVPADSCDPFKTLRTKAGGVPLDRGRDCRPARCTRYIYMGRTAGSGTPAACRSNWSPQQ